MGNIEGCPLRLNASPLIRKDPGKLLEPANPPPPSSSAPLNPEGI